MTPRPVGAVGASARAAAMSLARADFAPWAVDLFADRDLKRIAPVARCPFDAYPHAIPKLCDQFPPGPVLYTGGLENHPDAVRELAARRELWGNGPDVLERVRDPFALRAVLTAAGFDSPQLLSRGEPVPAGGTWLCKPVRSAGGHGIRVAATGEVAPPAHAVQECVDGIPMSAVFASIDGVAALIGVTEQIIGEPWLHAAPFRYAGTLAPIRALPPWCDPVHRLGTALTTAFGLRGIWGVDFVLNDDRIWLLEVNPRYTASVELLELAFGTALLPHHGMAFGAECATPSGPPIPGVLGKAVYFAPHRIAFPNVGPWDVELEAHPSQRVGLPERWRLPEYADIPAPGEAIESGWPVLTFFAAGATAEACRERLQSRAAELDQLFAEPAP